jgi:hypothetical protein
MRKFKSHAATSVVVKMLAVIGDGGGGNKTV